MLVTKYNINGVSIETLDLIGDNSSIQKFIDKNKTAPHHIAFLVDDILEAIEYFKNKNITRSSRCVGWEVFGGRTTM